MMLRIPQLYKKIMVDLNRYIGGFFGSVVDENGGITTREVNYRVILII